MNPELTAITGSMTDLLRQARDVHLQILLPGDGGGIMAEGEEETLPLALAIKDREGELAKCILCPNAAARTWPVPPYCPHCENLPMRVCEMCGFHQRGHPGQPMPCHGPTAHGTATWVDTCPCGRQAAPRQLYCMPCQQEQDGISATLARWDSDGTRQAWISENAQLRIPGRTINAASATAADWTELARASLAGGVADEAELEEVDCGDGFVEFRTRRTR